ncbi:hypothetical protein [Persicobacter psychrovividus]|uniref:hypothetical protein n=1 Tax=Persicobacter psychrovividus TaxID=387638 RepID=UPI003BAA9B2E
MRKENKAYIEIDKSGKLHLKPEKLRFTMIYRTASEVHWDDKKLILYSPKTERVALFGLVQVYR